MKKLLFILGIAFIAATLSSCYRHTVCATYLDASDEVEQIQNQDSEENL